jgi:hypothetical protein
MWIARAAAPPFVSAIIAHLIRNRGEWVLRKETTSWFVIGPCGISTDQCLHYARVWNGGMDRKKIAALAEKVRVGTFYVACSVLILGWVYWLWLAVKVGSFAMFAFGIFFPMVIVAAILGLWSLLVGMPPWLLHMVS